MTPLDIQLEQLGAAGGWSPNWPDVLARAGAAAAPSRVLRRRVVLAVAALVVVVAPLAAIGAVNDWWFLAHGPQPSHAPVVVRSGSWDGHPWELVAYDSTTDGLCLSITVPGKDSGAMGCGTFAGVPRTSSTKDGADVRLTFMTGQAMNDLPPFVAGAATEDAASVEIALADGTTTTLPTFTAAAPLDHVRFFAAPLAAGEDVAHRQGVKWVAALDADGTMISCLAPGSPRTADGTTALDTCR